MSNSWFQFRKLRETDDADSSQEKEDGKKWESDFYNRVSKASGVLPDLEKADTAEELAGWLRPFKESGFILALKNNTDKQEESKNRLAEIKAQAQKDLDALYAEVVQFKRPYSEKYDFYRVIADDLKMKRDRLGLNLDDWLTRRKEWEQRKEAAYAELRAIEEQVAAAKSDLLTKWFEEAKNRIKEILQAHHEVLKEKQKIARETFEQNKTQNMELADKLSEIRDRLSTELEDCRQRERIVAGEGSSESSNKFLIKTAFAVFVAAGLFFSVFTFNASFSSSDVASFVIEGLLHRAKHMIYNDFSRIFQLLGVLGIIALASLLSRAFIVHIKNRQNPDKNERDLDEQDLQLIINNDTIKYRGRFKSNNWPLFWFKVLPLFLFAGTIFIFIAYESTAGLFNSMGGFVMGSLCATGVAAFLYLYTSKVVEPRLLKASLKNGKVWAHLLPFKHFELTVAILFFIATTLFVAYVTFFQSPGVNNLPFGMHRLAALLWFLAITFLNGFVMAYGIRYKAFKDRQHELNVRIITYDSLIDHYKGVIRTDSNQRLNQQADHLFQRLMDHLIKRNNSIFRNGYAVRITRRQKMSSGQKSSNKSLGSKIANVLGRLVERLTNLGASIIQGAIHLVLPYDGHVNKQPDSFDLDEHVEQLLIPWEEEFFAELYHKKKVVQDEIDRYNNELKKMDKELTDSADLKGSLLSIITKSIDEAFRQQTICNCKILDADNAGRAGEHVIRAKYMLAQDMFDRGFETGNWFLRIDPDI